MNKVNPSDLLRDLEKPLYALTAWEIRVVFDLRMQLGTQHRLSRRQLAALKRLHEREVLQRF